MEICKLEHIHKDYRMGEVVTPLKDICLNVHAGDFIAVEGPSGIGKSTLLYVMGTLLQSDEGCYFFEGKDVSRLSDAEKSELRAKKIGFLFQDSTMIQALTLRENLIFTQGVGGKKDPKKVDELLYQFGLEDRADFFPHQLSGGQRRRAMAARALLHNPRLILADEPTNDLDDHWSEEVIRLLKEQAGKGTAVIMVTHNSRWAKTATRRMRLEDGVLTDMNA
ncbi:MAG: ATP-binding cassette domain-containing protein [Oscillospiraceae bacterium]|nr:ATP-binding cassette domain-containing protein [Oscillospiraceae bacterium]